MAVVTLELGKGQKFALPSTPGNLRKVLIPAGTRRLKTSTGANLFLELGLAQTTADDAAGTVSDQFRYGAGTFEDKLPGFGLGRGESLAADTYFFFAGADADQEVWMMPISEAD